MLLLRSLRKTYRMGPQAILALDRVHIEVGRSEFVAVMGPSGSGKSTLIHIMGCLHRPSSGTYALEGNNVETLTESQLARVRNEKIGFVFQTFNLLPRLNALNNVALPLIYGGCPEPRRAARARGVLESVGLMDRIHHRPNELSGGEQQRVAIARALVTHPSLLLADEPTGNLDSASGEGIMRIFSNLNRDGMTIVMVTHEDTIAAYAKRIIRLKDGKIVSDGASH